MKRFFVSERKLLPRLKSGRERPSGTKNKRAMKSNKENEEVWYVPEEARFIDVIFAMDSRDPGQVRLVCSRFVENDAHQVEIVETRFVIR